jgi:hypothetical protein
MIARWVGMLIAALAGGWMVFDGIHVVLRGKYFGPGKPGPWSTVFTKLGVDPFVLGPVFITLGVAWLTCLVAISGGKTWGWYGGAVVAVATLWYLPLGTILSLAYLAVFYVAIVRTGAVT